MGQELEVDNTAAGGVGLVGYAPASSGARMVTGIRHDPYANAHRIQVVVPKEGKADGRYVHPELYGKPLTKSVVVLPGMDPRTRPKLQAPPAAKQ